MNLLSIYVDRARFEIRAMLRDSRTVMFSMLLPIFLLVIFGSVFNGGTIKGTDVRYTQYLLAGMIASGLLYSAFQQLAIAVPEERSNGTLKRLYGSPAPRSVYFVGKFAVCAFTYIFQVVFLLGLGHIFYKVHLPVDVGHWFIFV
jgi:ABC-2 type transport system permease protein